jgi:hypothetical protein
MMHVLKQWLCMAVEEEDQRGREHQHYAENHVPDETHVPSFDDVAREENILTSRKGAPIGLWSNINQPATDRREQGKLQVDSGAWLIGQATRYENPIGPKSNGSSHPSPAIPASFVL